jgi:hypothetical protein
MPLAGSLGVTPLVGPGRRSLRPLGALGGHLSAVSGLVEGSAIHHYTISFQGIFLLFNALRYVVVNVNEEVCI